MPYTATLLEHTNARDYGVLCRILQAGMASRADQQAAAELIVYLTDQFADLSMRADAMASQLGQILSPPGATE
jgi:hypothetical protein